MSRITKIRSFQPTWAQWAIALAAALGPAMPLEARQPSAAGHRQSFPAASAQSEEFRNAAAGRRSAASAPARSAPEIRQAPASQRTLRSRPDHAGSAALAAPARQRQSAAALAPRTRVFESQTPRSSAQKMAKSADLQIGSGRSSLKAQVRSNPIGKTASFDRPVQRIAPKTGTVRNFASGNPQPASTAKGTVPFSLTRKLGQSPKTLHIEKAAPPPALRTNELRLASPKPTPQQIAPVRAAEVRRRLDKQNASVGFKAHNPKLDGPKFAPAAFLQKEKAIAVARPPHALIERKTAVRSFPNHAVKVGPRPGPLKDADLARIAAGPTAQKFKLAEQYRLMQHGDAARRLDLHKHGPKLGNRDQGLPAYRFDLKHGPNHPPKHHPNFHRGKVSPNYAQHCVKLHYRGPSFFAGMCLYPRWSSWVAWSWGFHHRGPLAWDPRPVWCRPAFYDPCPTWVYWETPVFLSLPEEPCGTWIDVKPIVIAEDLTDVQLLAVRFVDPGHPDENLGPRYRVWFRNNGSRAITQPFDVMLFGGTNDRLSADLPQAGVRVTGVEPNAIQSVDIRLPVEANAIGRDDQGNPAPFTTLHVLVDAGRELSEITRADNGVNLPAIEVLPVDPAAFELDPAAAKPGDEVVLAGEGLGPEPGQVLVHVNGIEMEAEIQGWYDLGVRWTMPKLMVAAPTEAEVIIIRGDGAATNPLKLMINP